MCGFHYARRRCINFAQELSCSTPGLISEADRVVVHDVVDIILHTIMATFRAAIMRIIAAPSVWSEIVRGPDKVAGLVHDRYDTAIERLGVDGLAAKLGHTGVSRGAHFGRF